METLDKLGLIITYRMSFLGIEKENILSMQPNPKYFKEVKIGRAHV